MKLLSSSGRKNFLFFWRSMKGFCARHHGLDHPGIVPVYEVGSCDGQPYFSMGYIEGRSLADIQTTVPRPPREAAEWVRQTAEAIEHAHAAGVVHRDRKPSNILLEQRTGVLRVTDFGLDRQVRGESKLTVTGQILDTPGFMAPEQARGEADHVAPAADIHALGAVLYYLLTGRPPFQADNVVNTLMQTVREEPVSPRRLNASVPRDLETICLKCLQKEPSKRYGSASEVAADLQRWLSGHPILARPVSRAEQVWRWGRRNPLTASMSLLSLLSVLALAAISFLAYVRTAQSLAESDQRLYANQLMLASRELDARHRNQALWLLRETGQQHRGWEWNYLLRRCFPEQVVIREVPEDGKLIWPAGQRRLLEASGELRNPTDGTRTQPEPFLERDLSADQRTAIGVDPNDFNCVKLLDVLTGTILRQWTIQVEHALKLVLSADGQRVVTVWAQGQSLHWRVWSRESDEPGPEQQRDGVCFAGVDQSRQWIAGDLVDGDSVWRVIWDVDSGAEVLRALSVETVIRGWQCLLEQPTPDDFVLRDSEGEVEARFDNPSRVYKLCQSSDGQRLVTAATSEQTDTSTTCAARLATAGTGSGTYVADRRTDCQCVDQ